jgi:hypothetical protein
MYLVVIFYIDFLYNFCADYSKYISMLHFDFLIVFFSLLIFEQTTFLTFLTLMKLLCAVVDGSFQLSANSLCAFARTLR